MEKAAAKPPRSQITEPGWGCKATHRLGCSPGNGHSPHPTRGPRVLTVRESPRAATTWRSAGLRVCTGKTSGHTCIRGKEPAAGVSASCFKQDQKRDLHMCLGHGGRGYMRNFPIRDPTNKLWTYGERGAEGGGQGRGRWMGRWRIDRTEWDRPLQCRWLCERPAVT